LTAEIKLNHEKLEKLTREIFHASGMPEEDAAKVASHLVLANLRGVDSHGVSKVGIYVKRLKEGIVNKTPEITVEKESPISALLNADNGSGIVAATKGIEMAVRKAQQYGAGIVGIKNSNHCGMLADYIQYAVRSNCIALAMTNAPSVMAPWGGKGKFFGTNPISYGIPAGEENDIVFDMATSTVAKGKIVLAQMNNEKIPLGWAISKEGRPTTDPKEAIEGLILPVGGPKGYGIAFLAETLSSLFTGSAYGPFIGDLFTDFSNKQNTGQFFFVMRADLFQDLADFKKRTDEMIQEIRKVPLMEGVEKIYLPGEIEEEKYHARKEKGIPLTAFVAEELASIAEELRLASPIEKTEAEGFAR
jgi:ureidoglycolate dehydrogenase (NAD+)